VVVEGLLDEEHIFFCQLAGDVEPGAEVWVASRLWLGLLLEGFLVAGTESDLSAIVFWVRAAILFEDVGKGKFNLNIRG
jgi:hypothetical protein